MGCGISQGQQRAELFQPLFRLFALDRLRLVDNQNRVRLGDDINRAAGAELIQLHVNAPRILALGIERLRIDNHHIDCAIRREAVDFRELCGIIDEEANLLAIFLGKMLLRHLKGFIDALTDGDARHNHDELAPPVMLVQLIHGFDIGIGFADAGFHFDGQVIVSLQPFGRLNLVSALHLLQPLQNQLVGKLRHNALVAPAGEVRVIHDCLLTIALVHHIAGREIRLSGKDVHNGFRRIGLELLMLKLQLQSSSPPSSDNCSSSSFCKSSFLGRTVSYLLAKFAHNLSTASIG